MAEAGTPRDPRRSVAPAPGRRGESPPGDPGAAGAAPLPPADDSPRRPRRRRRLTLPTVTADVRPELVAVITARAERDQARARFAAAIKTARAAGFTTREVARWAGVDQSVISRIARGERLPPP